jgi:hypothetical protein
MRAFYAVGFHVVGITSPTCSGAGVQYLDHELQRIQ